MTELEKIQRAKMYMDKLANGINPIDDSVVPDHDVINNVRLSRCFFYVSDLLRQILDNGGITPQSQKKEKKHPFHLSVESRNAFAYSDFSIPVSEIARRLNLLIDTENMQKITYTTIMTWLFDIGILTSVVLPTGKTVKRPTDTGMSIGISVEERAGMQGTYTVVVYDRKAQQFIVDNLDAMAESHAERTKLQGTEWTQMQDDCLKDLFLKNVPEEEIAVTLKRSKSAIQSRLQKLGLRDRDIFKREDGEINGSHNMSQMQKLHI